MARPQCDTHPIVALERATLLFCTLAFCIPLICSLGLAASSLVWWLHASP